MSGNNHRRDEKKYLGTKQECHRPSPFGPARYGRTMSDTSVTVISTSNVRLIQSTPPTLLADDPATFRRHATPRLQPSHRAKLGVDMLMIETQPDHTRIPAAGAGAGARPLSRP